MRDFENNSSRAPCKSFARTLDGKLLIFKPIFETEKCSRYLKTKNNGEEKTRKMYPEAPEMGTEPILSYRRSGHANGTFHLRPCGGVMVSFIRRYYFLNVGAYPVRSQNS